MAMKILDYADDKRGYIRIVDGDKTVCDIFPFAAVGGVGVEQARENARMIVNAAQLWDALQGLKSWCEEGCPDGGRYAMVEAEAALKAIRIEP
jgi:hypothetical protein